MEPNTTPAPSAPAQPTQVANPGRATLRTIVQVGVPAFVGLVLILPLILQAVVEELGAVLPPSVTAWLVGAAAAVTALAGAVARVMAIPGVNAWLSKLGLDAGEPGPGK